MGRRLRGPSWVAIVVCAALVLRVALVLATPHYHPQEDSAVYDANAVHLVSHGGFAGSLETLHAGASAFYPPLFSIALGGVYEIVGVDSASARWEAGRLVEALLGALVVWLICAIAARLFGRRVAIAAGGLAAVYPPLVLVGSSLLSESLFIPLVLGAVLAALTYRDDNRLRWALLSGLMTGLAGLTRGNGIFLVIPLGALVWVARPRLSWQAVRAPAALVAIAALTLVPWTVRNASVFGRFVPIATDSGYTLAGTFNPVVQAGGQRFPAMWQMPQARVQQLYAQLHDANEASISDQLTSEALHYIRAHPVSVLKTAYWNSVRMLDLTPSVERFFAPFEAYPTWLAMTSVYAFWVLLAVAIAGAFTRTRRSAPAALWWCPITLYVTGVLFLGLTRGRSPLDPFLLMLAAMAIVGASERLRSHSPGLAGGSVARSG